MKYNNVKLSNTRLIISGNIVEIYNYSKPYSYNHIYKEREIIRSGKSRRDDNLYVAQRYLRRVIFANVNVWSKQTAFISFTFAKNIKDLKIANKLWTKFIRKLKTDCGRSLKYTAVVEFQKRGAVHYHVLFYNLPERYIRKVRKERTLAKLWGHGFVDIKTIRKMRSIRSIGAYVSKYLTKEMLDKRLIGEKVYFSSRGLKKPIEYRDTKRSKKVLDKLKLDRNITLVYNNDYTCQGYGNINYKQYLIRKKYD